ncbi:MAG: hypothetical protein WCV92_01970 [Candidatus Buchananbacteria bacterium]
MDNWGKRKVPIKKSTWAILEKINSAGLVGINFGTIVEHVMDSPIINPTGSDVYGVRKIVSSALQTLGRNGFITKEEKKGGLWFITEAGVLALGAASGPLIMGGIDSGEPVIRRSESIHVAIRRLLVERPGLTPEQIVKGLNCRLWNEDAVMSCLRFCVENGQRCFYRKPNRAGWLARGV